MPNITKRQNKSGTSYLIRVYVDETITGKQLVKSKTWKPPVNMRPSTADKEVNKIAAVFEDHVKKGLIAFDSSTRLGEYAKKWIENEPLAPKTRERYWDLYKRINTALGHIKLEKLQAQHLEEFYKNLAESGVNNRGNHALATELDSYMKKHKLTAVGVSKNAGVAASTIKSARHGNPILIKSAELIAAEIGVNVTKLFKICHSNRKLSDKTIHHHHRLITAILESAKRQRLVPFNVAREHTKAPKVEYKEAKYLSDEQAQEFLQLVLSEDDIRHKAAFCLLLFSGLRRGELCGLTWDDVDYKKELIHVHRASQYITGMGLIEVPTKNKSSIRAVKMPSFIFELLTEYKIWWNKNKLIYGKDWQGNANRLFIQDNGSPINPDTINFWLSAFLQKYNLPHITPHGLRHTFATLQITAGVDVRTLQARTGHAQASTLVNTYSHAIRSAQEAASEALENILLSKVN